VARDLRSAVTFAAHDLLSDPPFPHLDLVTCRNVLIYLEPAAQERLLERFHFALRPGGTLWLGAAETIGRRTDLFAQVPGGHRIYRATASGRAHSYPLAARRLPSVAPAAAPAEAATAPPRSPAWSRSWCSSATPCPAWWSDQGLEILYFFGPTDPS
jgi:two-component system, chemotaxis family, CheB/CheR fusion protein